MLCFSYEAFVSSTQVLSDLESYAQLLQRADRIGYRVNRVVFRGYHASDQLQVSLVEAYQEICLFFIMNNHAIICIINYWLSIFCTKDLMYISMNEINGYYYYLLYNLSIRNYD